jgi:integrase
MLSNISKSSHDNQQNIFANADDMRTNLFLQRRRVAKKLADPRILQIHFHTFRHWKATFEQHKTKDPWHVKTILGHKSISSTETYIHIEEMMYLNQNDNFTVRVANTLEEAIKLMEVGYEFHIEIDGNKLFRKRK